MPSDGLAIWTDMRYLCLSMPFLQEKQGALVPPHGESLDCEDWLPAHVNNFCATGGSWQLSQSADLGRGLQTQ